MREILCLSTDLCIDSLCKGDTCHTQPRVAPSKSIVVPVRYSGDLSSHLTSPLSSSGLPSLLRGEASATLSLQKSSGLTPSLEARAPMSWKVIAAGPTTSMRMESVEPEFIERTGVKMIIGKGGMGPRTAEAMRKFKAVYAVFTGGAGALAAEAIKSVKAVHWLDKLGMAEAMWVFEVEEFGPLTITIDSTGANYYEMRLREVAENARAVKRELGLPAEE